MSGYFGPPQFRKVGEEQIPVPVGSYCIYCGEGFAEGDMGQIDAGGSPMHYECLIRAIVGSVGHQQRRCSCYGGSEEDPEGMTRREAAKAAERWWRMIQHQALRDDLANLDRIFGDREEEKEV